MKKLISILVLILPGFLIYGQNDPEVIANAKVMIDNKKYSSAFKLLSDLDPKNEKPDFVLLKEEIALNYFINSIMHQMFGLKDLKINENVFDLRGQEGISNMYSFPINEILENLIKKYPNNYKLYKGLGDYYYEVHLKYGDKWLKNNDALFELIEKNYLTAISHDEYDYLTYYALGYISLTKEKYKESIPLFIKSISLNEKYASSFYNLAYAYLYIDDREKALQNAMKALDLYDDQTYKGDAARMIATIYSELKNEPKMIEFYELSNSIDPNNYYTLKPLLNLYVKTNSDKVISLTNTFYNLAPDKPTIYNDLSSIYFENQKSEQLAQFFKSNLNKYAKDPKIFGNLNFYLGRLYYDTDKKLATEYFLKSKEIFAQVYEKDNPVFKTIDKAIEELK